MESLTQGQRVALVAVWVMMIGGCLPLIKAFPGVWFALVLLPGVCASAGIATREWRYALLAIGLAWLCLAIWLEATRGYTAQMWAYASTLAAAPWIAVAASIGVIVGRELGAPVAIGTSGSHAHLRPRLVLALPLALPVVATVVTLAVLSDRAAEVRAEHSAHMQAVSPATLLAYRGAIADYRLALGVAIAVLAISVLIGSCWMAFASARVEGGQLVGLTGAVCSVALWRNSANVALDRAYVPNDMLMPVARTLFAVLAACAVGTLLAVKWARTQSQLAAEAELRTSIQSSLQTSSQAHRHTQPQQAQTNDDVHNASTRLKGDRGSRLAVRCPHCGADNARIHETCVVCGRALSG